MKSTVQSPIQIFHGNYFKHNGLNYHYIDRGEGPPVVMVHGNPTWSIYYRNLVEELSNSHRCIVPDHIGCGFSSKPDDTQYNYTYSQRVDDLHALIEHLNFEEKITLVVHDWGGAIGMAYATMYPEKIEKIVILNTAAFLLPGDKPLPRALWLGRHSALGDYLIRKFNIFSFISSWTSCTQNKMPRALRRAYRLPYNNWENRIATARFVQDIPLTPEDASYARLKEVEDNLHKLKDVPKLICWGEKDFVFDLDFLAEWERRFPDAEVHRYPKAGHYILEDAAHELVPLIGNFIRGAQNVTG